MELGSITADKHTSCEKYENVRAALHVYYKAKKKKFSVCPFLSEKTGWGWGATFFFFFFYNSPFIRVFIHEICEHATRSRRVSVVRIYLQMEYTQETLNLEVS